LTSVAIVGATGVVGRTMLSILEERDVLASTVRLIASHRSVGQTFSTRWGTLEVEDLALADPSGIDIALFSAGADRSLEHAKRFVEFGSVVIDNSSAFRMDPDVPLVVAQVNDEAAGQHNGIIANPNCSTIIALMAVTPLHRVAGIKRMVVATYQAASGAGAAFARELEQQAEDHVAGRPYTQETIGRQYIFNLFSHDSPIGPDGYNEEETKLVRETHKIWDDTRPAITATCIRVPVLRAHSEAINLTFNEPLTEDEARELLAAAPGVRIVDDRDANRFPEPADADGIDEVLVGRIRGDRSQPPGMGLDLFVCGDQIRKGAALNAVQIAELLVNRKLVTKRAAA